MTLIKSISGIRGTIGGKQGEGLTPQDIVRFASSYAIWVQNNSGKKNPLVVIGRDARLSGLLVNNLVVSTLNSLGLNVIDTGLTTTPTVELAVVGEEADGGIIITASHNPKEWNALKLLDSNGEFLNALSGEEIVRMADENLFEYSTIDDIGWYRRDETWNSRHVRMVVEQELVNLKAVQSANIKVVIDSINSSASLIIPELLTALGVEMAGCINCEPNGIFSHNPEPLAENLTGLSEAVVGTGAHMGFALDPDSDRLAIICEDGTMFGEEYTLVSVADYVLSVNPGPAVSNMSSTRALADVAARYGQSYFTSAVGEVNVVAEMKKQGAVIGGEGNGGVIYPPLHYGRDALMGIALFLSYYAIKKMKASQLRDSLPVYVIAKKKLTLTETVDFETLFGKIENCFPEATANYSDGLRLDFKESWVHIRRSNTEPIIRIYAEAANLKEADNLAESVIEIVKKH